MTMTSCAANVLIFDEYALSRCGAAATLAQAYPAWNIRAVGTVPDLLRQMRAETWSLLLLDLPTLGKRAEELLEICMRDCPTSKVVTINGAEDTVIRRRLIAAGVAGYLSHEASSDELCRLASFVLAAPERDYACAVSSLLSEPPCVFDGPARPEMAGFGSKLTVRQAEVLRLMAQGRSTKDIARRLGVAVGTVKAHLSGTYRVLGAHSRVDALAKAGLIEIGGPGIASKVAANQVALRL